VCPFAVEVPPGIDPVHAAPLTCAAATTYKAVNVAGIRPSSTRPSGTGPSSSSTSANDKLDLATELGATHVGNALDVHPEDTIRDLGGADVAIVPAASNSAIDNAFNGSLSFPTFDTSCTASR
jgi:propanol-preferring alcohol dehydrogenase